MFWTVAFNVKLLLKTLNHQVFTQLVPKSMVSLYSPASVTIKFEVEETVDQVQVSYGGALLLKGTWQSRNGLIQPPNFSQRNEVAPLIFKLIGLVSAPQRLITGSAALSSLGQAGKI